MAPSKMKITSFVMVAVTLLDKTTAQGCSSMNSISASQLQCVFPGVSGNAQNYASLLSQYLGGSLATSCEWAAFLANVGTESGGMTEWTQLPCDSGDDAPYCGRGPLQITGSSNYNFCQSQGSCNCGGIVNNPQSVSSSPQIGIGTAACVWESLSGHSLSDNVDGTINGLHTVACYINYGNSNCDGGDPNGWGSRQNYWNTANGCLGNSGKMIDPHTSNDGIKPSYGNEIGFVIGSVAGALVLFIIGLYAFNARKPRGSDRSTGTVKNPVFTEDVITSEE